MNSLVNLKTDNDDFQVEYEVLTPIDISAINGSMRRELANAMQDINTQIDLCNQEIKKLDAEINRLTNQADGLDYIVAVASGVLTGLIDSFFVGETEIDKKKVEKMLAEKYHTANDDEYRNNNKGQTTSKSGQDSDDESESWISSSKFHRLDDLAHHPTPFGLLASILVRYFRLVIFVDGKDGKPHIFPAGVPKNEKTRKLEQEQLIKAWAGAIFSGLFMWLANVAENKCEEAYGEDMPEALRKIIKALGRTPIVIEILKAADNWVGHMMSDVSTPQGIPGVFLSLLKMISVLPGVRKTNLPAIVKDLYKGGKWNLPEWGGVVFVAAKKQAMPVLINEVLVRGFYFVRRLINESQKQNSFKGIDWQNVIPFGNRTIVRMMTIASATFTAVDIADAAIRSGGFNPKCLLRINFVGIGRFAIAVGTDVGMGIKKNKVEKRRIQMMSQQLALYNAKVYYMCADIHFSESDMLKSEERMWISAISTEETLAEAYEAAEESAIFIKESLVEMKNNFEKISDYRDAIEINNPGLIKDCIKILRYGRK